MSTDELPDDAPHALIALDSHMNALEAASQLLAHLTTTDLEIHSAELNAIVVMIDDAHDGIEANYNRARKLLQEQKEAHEAALDEARAEVAPGSAADLKRAEAIWSMLRAFVKVAAEECDEALGLEKRP